MFVKIDVPAVDEGLLAFNRAIALMRKHPQVLEPVSKALLATVLVLISQFICAMFFGRSLSPDVVAGTLTVIAIVAIWACLVVEMLATIVVAANVRSTNPLTPKQVRAYVKSRFISALKAEPLSMAAFTMLALLVTSGGFLVYLFAGLALALPDSAGQMIAPMIVCSLVWSALTACASLYAVLTGRYLVVHGMAPAAAFARARQAVGDHKNPCMAVCVVSTIMGFSQALLAFVVVANHILVPTVLGDVLGIVVSLSMFAIMWIIQIVPYIALTERRNF